MSVEELSGSGIKEFFDNLGLEGELLPIEQLYRPGWAEQSGKIFVGIVHSVSNLVDLNEAKMMLVCIHEVDCCFKIGLRLPVTTYNAFAVVLHRIGIKKGDLIAFRSAVVEDYTIPGKSVKIKAHIGLSTIDDAKIFYKILDMTVYSERLMILTVCDGTPFKRKEDEGSRRAVVNVRNPRPPINLLQKNSLVCLKNVQVEAVALSAEVPELVLSLTLQGPMGTVRGLSLEESDMLQRRLCFNPPPHSPISAPQRMLPSVSDKRKVESGEDEPARKKGQPSGEDKNKFEASTSCLSNDETLEFVSAGEDPETEINDSECRKYSSDVRNVENVETTTISELLSTEGGAEGQSYLIEALLKDVQPSVGRDLVVLHCCACGEVSNYKKLVHCEVCKNNGSLSRLNKMFLLRLHLEDPEGTGDEMVVTVSDYDAVEFLGCTVLAFLNDSEMFEKITSVLLRLLDESALPRELRPRLKLAVTWEGTTYKVHGTHICDFPN